MKKLYVGLLTIILCGAISTVQANHVNENDIKHASESRKTLEKEMKKTISTFNLQKATYLLSLHLSESSQPESALYNAIIKPDNSPASIFFNIHMHNQARKKPLNKQSIAQKVKDSYPESSELFSSEVSSYC